MLQEEAQGFRVLLVSNYKETSVVFLGETKEGGMAGLYVASSVNRGESYPLNKKTNLEHQAGVPNWWSFFGLDGAT